MSAASGAIELKNVTVQFRSETVLKNVSLKIDYSERVAVIGPSGQGKSVLLKTLGGLIQPTSGQVFIEGHDWHSLRGVKKQEILGKLGMLFQKNALFDSLTCGENVAFPLREINGPSSQIAEDEIQKKVDYFLDAVGIPHAKNLFPDEISGGMQKRLGIARALALDPDIIFYDDPTAGLDPITSRKIIDLICELQKKRNSTLVAITNDMNRAYQLADRILMVIDQNVIEAGSPKTIKENQDPRVHQFIRGELKGPLTVMA